MESLASGMDSEPVFSGNENMRGIENWINGAGKKKKRLSVKKRDRKKSSTHGNHVSSKTFASELDILLQDLNIIINIE